MRKGSRGGTAGAVVESIVSAIAELRSGFPTAARRPSRQSDERRSGARLPGGSPRRRGAASGSCSAPAPGCSGWACGWSWRCCRGSCAPGRTHASRGRTPAAAASAADARKIHATLFYVAQDGTELVPVSREVPYGDTPAEQARRIIEAQLQPPAGRTAAPRFPPARSCARLPDADRRGVRGLQPRRSRAIPPAVRSTRFSRSTRSSMRSPSIWPT